VYEGSLRLRAPQALRRRGEGIECDSCIPHGEPVSIRKSAEPRTVRLNKEGTKVLTRGLDEHLLMPCPMELLPPEPASIVRIPREQVGVRRATRTLSPSHIASNKRF